MTAAWYASSPTQWKLTPSGNHELDFGVIRPTQTLKLCSREVIAFAIAMAAAAAAAAATSGARSPMSSPRLPSPPPIAEDQTGPRSPLSAPEDSHHLAGRAPADHASSRRIRPGTKAADINEGPPLTELSEVRSDPLHGVGSDYGLAYSVLLDRLCISAHGAP